ncbi:hypothetical protein GCK72_015540 [Caenorhabditis remanei]|uniref:DUF7154 domain-containing protein n=1 Tax=Caenorhabditis remanei TaxID=31234 RepID=A0A6A5GUC3_CAERE|nr:hypothetical protein GCK72_015540 [Caenorhabditis remanei]KAF1759080.1 hypothetical protein GCK72_015540 [Caenorhabditis remanei]
MVAYGDMYTTTANVRFDTKQEEEIEYHTDSGSLNASLWAHQPDPSFGYGDKTTGSNLYNVLKKFLDNGNVSLCGAQVFVLVKRYPDETDGFDPMTWIITRPYQFLASNFVVSGSGRIEIPAFKTPLPVGDAEYCTVAITIQNHTLDNSFVSMSYTIASTDGSYIYEFPSDSVNPLYGTAQSDDFDCNGYLSYKWTIDYHYNTDKPQIIECRMYSQFYHDFLPLPPF